jgi:hypothetical protein
MMKRISNYKDLCKTVGDMLEKNNLNWPLYDSTDGQLGDDSAGGTDGTLYGAMCKSGFLTTDSQDGFCDAEEEQKAYVCFYCPRKALSKLRKALLQNKVPIDIFDEDEEIHSFVNNRFTDKQNKTQNRLISTAFLKQESKPYLEVICSWDKVNTIELNEDIRRYDLVNCIAISLIPCSQQLHKLEDQMYRINVF